MTDSRPEPAADPAMPSDEAAQVENPYWAAEEPPPHPEPWRGCIRRGLCCRSSPGWFAPGEVEAAATFLGVTPDHLVRTALVIDAVDVDGERVEAFAPVKLDRFGQPALPPGTRTDALYRFLRGQCVFFDGAGCRIYGARPLECRGYVCTNADDDNPRREDIGRLWRDGAAPPAE